MDGKGGYADNIFVERQWRTVKYEEVYPKAYVNAVEARRERGAYFRFYNNLRPHQALDYQTPAEVFHGDPTVREGESKDRRCSDRPLLGSSGRGRNGQGLAESGANAQAGQRADRRGPGTHPGDRPTCKGHATFRTAVGVVIGAGIGVSKALGTE